MKNKQIDVAYYTILVFVVIFTISQQGCTIQGSILYHGKSDISHTDESPGFRNAKYMKETN